MALKVGASSGEGGVTPRAVHLLLLVHLRPVVLLGLPLHAVRSWLPWLQLWDRGRCNLWQEGRGEGGCGGLEGAGRLREWLEERRLVRRGVEGCTYLGAVHVPLRRCQRGEGKVGRVYIETSGTHGAAAAHLNVMEMNVRLGRRKNFLEGIEFEVKQIIRWYIEKHLAA